MKDEKEMEPTKTPESDPPTGEDAGTAGNKARPEESAGDASGEGQTELLKKLEQVQSESEDFKNRYLRAVADLENYRKRSVREKEELRTVATAGLVEDLLPILDNMVLGLRSAEVEDSSVQSIREGFAMVLSQLRAVLSDYGVRELDPKGENFDPNLHDCVSHQPHPELDEGKVIETVRVGYQLRERLIRPAAVVVSAGANDGEESPTGRNGS